MQFSLIAAFGLTTFATMVAGKGYIVSFNKGTSPSDVSSARSTLAKDCSITHDYTLFQGFAVDCPEDAMEAFEVSVKDAGASKPNIEDDQVTPSGVAPNITRSDVSSTGGVKDVSSAPSSTVAGETVTTTASSSITSASAATTETGVSNGAGKNSFLGGFGVIILMHIAGGLVL
ncbi:hypothetical protein EDC01DRAFT_631545 [Geopyxis carbonaria]|nr:hypothetical protein EDC01DRAFT_631545 [Geopyxis carbonaria]